MRLFCYRFVFQKRNAMNTKNFSGKYGYHIQEIDASYCNKDFLQVSQSILVLCLTGEVTFEVNMVKMQIRQRCLATFSKMLTMRLISASADFKAVVLTIDDELSSQIAVGIPVQVFEKILREPVREIVGDSDWQMLSGLMNVALTYRKTRPVTAFSREVVGGITRCMFLMYGESVMATASANEKMVYTMGDNYFRRFVDLLQKNVKQEHEVSFYAEQLHITPKYLGEVCKHKSGHKAKDIISFMLLTNIKRDVILSGKSIKNIAYEYNFADQSSFGKFFKKMTGMSPLAFKKGAHSDFYD